MVKVVNCFHLFSDFCDYFRLESRADAIEFADHLVKASHLVLGFNELQSYFANRLMSVLLVQENGVDILANWDAVCYLKEPKSSILAKACNDDSSYQKALNTFVTLNKQRLKPLFGVFLYVGEKINLT